MTVKKPCILKYVKRKTKDSLQIFLNLLSKSWKRYAVYIYIYNIYTLSVEEKKKKNGEKWSIF